MMLINAALLVLSVLFACQANAQIVSKQTTVAESGETKLAARSSNFDVQILIKTRPAEKSMETMVEAGDYVERSHVERIQIIVAGKQLFVPRSIFCDLYDLHNAKIRLMSKTVVLALEGGDASASYWVKIEFDSKLVKRRTGGSGMIPGKIGTEFIYHQLVLKDE